MERFSSVLQAQVRQIFFQPNLSQLFTIAILHSFTQSVHRLIHRMSISFRQKSSKSFSILTQKKTLSFIFLRLFQLSTL